MKMSDVFNLPLEVRGDLIFFSKSETCYAKVEGVASRKEELEVSSAIHKAVNNFDRLEQENAELREFAAYCQGFLGCEKTRESMALHSITLRAKELLNK